MTINLEQARILLKQAMETKGRNFVYNTDPEKACFYEPHGEVGPKSETGCLIGTALTLAGETRHIGYLSSVRTLRWVYPNMMTGAAMEYFQVAQNGQDFGKSWGQAYDDAEASLS